jgi:acetoin utilization protein AcuB
MSDSSAPTVQEHMTPDPVTVEAGASVAHAAQLMRERNIRHLPVLEEGRLVGVLSERDVHVARSLRSLSLEKARVDMIMIAPPVVVTPDALLSDVAAHMVDKRAGAVLVAHEGRLVGIFTSHDALHALHRIAAARA